MRAAAKALTRDGDLGLLGDYWIIGLGSGFGVYRQFVEDAVEVTGRGNVVKAATGTYKGVRVSFIASAGGGIYVESHVALACHRGVRGVIGLGFCGSLGRGVKIGDIVIPIAAVRDEDTSAHYVDVKYPAVADYVLLSCLVDALRDASVEVHVGIVVTTSSTFAESVEWAKTWYERSVLCVDCETSILYTLTRLADIPSAVALVVSDNVYEEREAFGTKGFMKATWWLSVQRLRPWHATTGRRDKPSR